MTKNIVICCDGTGNGIGGDATNVLRLYRMLAKHPGQRVLYSPGVGTIGYEDAWQRVKQRIRGVLGLATGYGLDEDVLGAYRYLIATYEPGDRVWLFGFSRGAYAMRVLAAFTHVVGLLPPDQANLAGPAFTAYKKASVRDRRKPDRGAATAPDTLRAAWDFGRVAGGRPIRIEFLGVWDTVASVIVPRAGTFLPAIQTLRFTRTNASVKTFRQAIALDERRRMFRLNRWADPQAFRRDPFDRGTEVAQDVRQVWFAGVHADVGGGYPEAESALSKFPLGWMVEEARAKGLEIDPALHARIVMGDNPGDRRETHASPDVLGPAHDSMNTAWRILELLPKKVLWSEWPERPRLAGWNLPLAEPRVVPAGSLVHWSALMRIATMPSYRPENLNVADVMQEGMERLP